MFRHKDKSPECPQCGSGINAGGEGHHPYCSVIGSTSEKFNPMRLNSEQQKNYPYWVQCISPCHCGCTTFLRDDGPDEVYTCINCCTEWRQEDVPF